MTNGEENNQYDSSQPSNAEGTNGVESISEPISGGMSDSQTTDYYNKTQDLAQQRRAFEAERQQFEIERQNHSTSYGQQSGGFQGNNYFPQEPQTPFAQQPFQQQPQPQQNVQQNPNSPEVFNKLVKELGYDAAVSVVQSFNQLTGPIQREIYEAKQQFEEAKKIQNQLQVNAIMSDIHARGRELYGDEWKKRSDKVIQNIITYNGLPLEKAWLLETAGTMKQTAIDEAYSNQQQKNQANVAVQSNNPAQSGAPVINSFKDAFQAAAKQHGMKF